MYGTIARLKLKPGGLAQLQAWTDQVGNASRLADNGHVATYIYQADADPNEVFMVVLFESKEKYHQNANSPEQNADYERMSQLFTEFPQWHDGEIVWSQDKRIG